MSKYKVGDRFVSTCDIKPASQWTIIMAINVLGRSTYTLQSDDGTKLDLNDHMLDSLREPKYKTRYIPYNGLPEDLFTA